MNVFNKTVISLAISTVLLTACSTEEQKVTDKIVDLLITKGSVYTGENEQAQQLDVAICQQVICGLYVTGEHHLKAKRTIDATGKIVSPGFIDPHTHSLAELLSKDKNHNLNYLTQGVTTVVNGNDGGGPVDIKATAEKLTQNGIGTNTALLVGHGSLREQVMGRAERFATSEELSEMSALLTTAMEAGGIGLSTGLYYVPGSYANTDEVITLAKIASHYGGIYDTHLRDESTFTIGFTAALDEAINIADKADIHLHLAHIKALGVDVWGQSKQAIETITQAQQKGTSISADQYPWLASGTKLRSAVMPKWVMADSTEAFHLRLNKAEFTEQLAAEITENIRRRGGPDSLYITEFSDKSLVSLNLLQVSELKNLSVVDTAIWMVQQGDVRVASFNMSPEDVERFMVQPWVVTSSDGTNGHPRKYASFPQKYQTYVVDKKLLTIAEFINRSSSQTAKLLGLDERGLLKVGYQADVIVFDQQGFAPKANFSQWNNYSVGVEQVIVNGTLVIENEKFGGTLAGKFIQ
ncbi:N-acyl-D-amino-acid deacylase family protein [Colwellia psychrerythraea]|uniref:N-acyl-D-amino-acid deacylase n=1 Tax=Colwellia psychrerythraea TaxID=28229 RepID=A0A099KE96_COLPS|nr:amidohydrolase family protein [Colwellia psychrerythraea]KGJ88646.1 N-acyl-D-amino-acid deacylase [Colwellia psychrerythraea]